MAQGIVTSSVRALEGVGGAIMNALPFGESPSDDKETVKSKKVKRPKLRSGHVDVYSEFFNTVTPLDTPNSDADPKSTFLSEKDCYAWHLDDSAWSVNDDMLSALRELVNSGQIHWHWVSSQWQYAANFDEVCGFDSRLTSSKDMINGDKDKLKVIKKALKRNERGRQKGKCRHNIVWIDPGVGPDQKIWWEYARLAHDAHVSLLKLTPFDGLRPSEVRQLQKFVELSEKPTSRKSERKNRHRGLMFYLATHSKRLRGVPDSSYPGQLIEGQATTRRAERPDRSVPKA